MRFTAMLWQPVEPIFQAILALPFIRELADGTLSHDRFVFYLQQDALYLADYGRALALIGGRSTDPARMLDLVRLAEGAVVFERALHERHFQRYGVLYPTAVQSPACLAYTNYLLATAAHRSYEEGVAALLPCYSVYQAVGKHIQARAAPHNPYQEWIDLYAGEEFGALVDQANAITDEVAEAASSAAREAMQAAFILASRLEWLFWDSAYRMEGWPPALGPADP